MIKELTKKDTNMILIKDAISSDLHVQIQYEWLVVRENVEKKYIRGIYSSLDRLIKLYKKRDIKM